jgi:hypothetical protein
MTKITQAEFARLKEYHYSAQELLFLIPKLHHNSSKVNTLMK